MKELRRPSPPRGRLLLIEDDPALGPIARDVLGEVYEVVLVADGAEGLREALSTEFDVLVVDRRLPGLSGLEVVQALRAAGSAVPILVLTALGTVSDRVAGLDAGANDYLVKPFDFDELLARLRAIQRTFPVEGPGMTIGQWEFYPRSRMIHSPYVGRITLTEKENDLLELLSRDPGRAFSRQRILRLVFTRSDHPGLVDTYVHYVRRKTDRDMIHTVRGIGYRLGSP